MVGKVLSSWAMWPPMRRLLLNQIDLEAGGGQIERGLDTADASTDNHDVADVLSPRFLQSCWMLSLSAITFSTATPQCDCLGKFLEEVCPDPLIGIPRRGVSPFLILCQAGYSRPGLLNSPNSQAAQDGNRPSGGSHAARPTRAMPRSRASETAVSRRRVPRNDNRRLHPCRLEQHLRRNATGGQNQSIFRCDVPSSDIHPGSYPSVLCRPISSVTTSRSLGIGQS